MKSKLFFAGILLALTVAFVSCNKEELAVEPTLEQADNLEARTSGLAAGGVDLSIPNMGTNVPTTTTICGPTLPNISCAGGTRNFIATAGVRNNGPMALPAGTFKVRWVDVTTGSVLFPDQVVNHTGIAVGQIYRVNRPIYVGPCDCVPPFTSFTHTYQAYVDFGNQVAETNEGNNRSPLLNLCDGC